MRPIILKILCFALIALVQLGVNGADPKLDETFNSKTDSDIYIDLLFSSLGSVEYKKSPEFVKVIATRVQRSYLESVKSEIWNGKIQNYVKRNNASVIQVRAVDNLLDLMEYGTADEKRTSALLLELMHYNAKAFIPDHTIWRKWIGDNRQQTTDHEK